MAREYAITSVLLQRDFLPVLIVVINAFSWYFPLYLFFQSTLEGFQVESTFLLVAFGIHYVVAVVSAIMGAVLVKKIPSRDTLLSIWMFVGTVASTLMIALGTFGVVYILAVSLLLGISLGLGFPSCLAYFGDCTIEENRGWLAGIIFFASSFCIFFIGLLLSFSTLVVGALILAAWRGTGLVLFLLTRSRRDYPNENMTEVSYRSVLLDRSFLLYLIPWTMFCLINFIENPIVNDFFGEDLASFIPIAEFGIGSFAALIGGRVSDSVGRKRVVIFGFIALGIGYAILGFFSSITLSRYLYLILDGIAWGIFLMMFFMVIWSELAGKRIKEKYYLIGALPFLFSSYLQIVFTPYAELVDISTAFSLASFFLFLAVFPILLAPETLPEKKMELRRLRRYVEKAKEFREKHKEKRSIQD